MSAAEKVASMSYDERLYRAVLFLHITRRVIPVDMLARLQASGVDIRRFI